MSIFENLEKAGERPIDPEQASAELAAQLLFENFIEFAKGQRDQFSAYFVFNYPLHDMQREHFVRLLQSEYPSSAEMPEGTIVATPEISLVAQSNAEVDELTQVAVPWDITYTAVRFAESTAAS